ncbi:MAG: tetratricopeptide repeat protein [Hyphomicrobiales bacterium]|nr:tetratricopeptide repeat protein [Hyphomicrobiales bacterium]
MRPSRRGPRTRQTSQLLERAIAHHQAGRLDEAERLYADILQADPVSFDARHLLGVIRHQQGRSAEAAALIAAALTLSPHSARALGNYGAVLTALGRLDEALAVLDRAVQADPQLPDAHNSRGAVLLQLGRAEEALPSFEQALSLRPSYVEALNNRGNALQELHRAGEALASYDRALALRPDYPESHYNRGCALRRLARDDEALAAFDRAVVLRPDYPDAVFSRADVLSRLKRYGEAIALYEQAIVRWPDHPHALSGFADTALTVCDWSHTAALTERLTKGIAAGTAVVNPFAMIRLADDPALHLQCARGFARDRLPQRPPLRSAGTWNHERIRIAYLSADYHNHATAYLIAELIELHDRSRFEIIGVSYGPDDSSHIRKRLIAAFDRFLEVRDRSDREIAVRLAALQTDIAVDLKGYTRDSRPGILAFRPAPIQAQWLGYPGTLGTDVVDYVIANDTVAPVDHAAYYDEHIVRLPDCYQVNDRKRAIAEHTSSRAQAGLPEQGFVFCCFNNSFKILPAMFEVWMRLLRDTPGSVLWLLHDNADAQDNLRAAASARGIDPARLVFASRCGLADHLARHRLADLFLDTLPYNAHTTASDALWAGLPVLTCQGRAFAGRVGASLLRAAGLGDLVTHSLDDYEALARRLASAPAMLADVRSRLAADRLTCALFDTDRFRRHMETAYRTMWETWQRGEPPHGFSVSPANG